jgi:hypothetical protein
MLRATVAGLVLLSLGVRLSAAEVEIHLKNGERLYGDLISQDNDQISINHKVWTRGGLMQGPMTVFRTTVLDMVPADDLMALYSKRDKAATDAYDQQYSLARWCFERGLQQQAFDHAKRLYEDDPSDQVTQELITTFGYVLDNGTWVKEADYAKSHGLVNFEGRLVTPAQVDLRRKDMKADLEKDRPPTACTAPTRRSCWPRSGSRTPSPTSRPSARTSPTRRRRCSRGRTRARTTRAAAGGSSSRAAARAR